MKCIIFVSVWLNILRLICINRQYPPNCIAFDNDTRVLLNFRSKYSKTKTISNTFLWLVTPDKIQHDHPLLWQPSSVFLAADPSLGSVCPGFAEPRSRSELASSDQCLKFCNVTPSATTPSTLNNPWDVDLDCSAGSFLVQWTQVHWNAGKRQCGVNGVQDRRSVLLEHEVVVRDSTRLIAMSKPSSSSSSTFSQY